MDNRRINNNINLSELLNIIPSKEDLEKFEIWKANKRKKTLKLIIFLLILLIFVGVLIYPVFLDASVLDKIFGIICYIVFIWLEIYFINKYIKIRSWTMDKCNYGTIVDKYRSLHHSIDSRPTKNASGKNSVPHLIVLTEGRRININTCSKDEYRSLEVNDTVIIFLAGDQRLYVIKKD